MSEVKADDNSKSKTKLKRTAVITAIFTFLLVGISVFVFTCCTDSSTVPSDLSSMQWDTYLKNGHFVKSGSSYDCSWTAMDVRSDSGEYIVKLYSGNDSVEYRMELNGSDGTIYAGGGALRTTFEQRIPD